MSEWINVNDSPLQHGKYLVSNRDVVDVFTYNGTWFDEDQTTLMEPTHWMPLPEPPEVK